VRRAVQNVNPNYLTMTLAVFCAAAVVVPPIPAAAYAVVFLAGMFIGPTQAQLEA